MFTLGAKVEVFGSPSFRPSKTSVSVVAAGSSEAGADPGVGTSAEVVVVSMPREMRRCLLSAVVDTVGTVVTSGIQNRIIRVKKIWILRHPACRFFSDYPDTFPDMSGNFWIGTEKPKLIKFVKP